MPGRRLTGRLTRIDQHRTPAIDPQFRAFAADVIRFGGHEPTPEAVERLARWYAGRYRERGNRVASLFLMTPYRALSDGPQVS
jgi:hypothetical protein